MNVEEDRKILRGALLIALATIVLLGIVAFSFEQGQRYVRREAVRCGAASYEADPGGACRFRWKEGSK